MFDIYINMKTCGKSYKESETEGHSPVCSSGTIAFYCHPKSFWNKVFCSFRLQKAHDTEALKHKH